MYVYQFIESPLLDKSQKSLLLKYNIYVEECCRADGKTITYILNYSSEVDYNNKFINDLLNQCVEVDKVVDDATYQKRDIMPYEILSKGEEYPLIGLFGFGPFEDQALLQNSVCLFRGDGNLPESFDILGLPNITMCEYFYDALFEYLTVLQTSSSVTKVSGLCVDHSISWDDNIKMIKERFNL